MQNQPVTNSKPRQSKRRRGQKGSAAIEISFIGPWFFFLFVGALDLGFFTNALISLESAARTAALYTSSSANSAADSTGACTIALSEMRKLPNIGSSVNACTGNPVSVTASTVTGPDAAAASQVAVKYTTISLIPLPGVIASQFTITRTVIMRLRG